jgi:hypothetical protein
MNLHRSPEEWAYLLDDCAACRPRMTDYACSKCAQGIIGSAIADIATLAADCEQAKQDALTYWTMAEEYAKKNKAQAERIGELEHERDVYREYDDAKENLRRWDAIGPHHDTAVLRLSRADAAVREMRERGKG